MNRKMLKTLNFNNTCKPLLNLPLDTPLVSSILIEQTHLKYFHLVPRGNVITRDLLSGDNILVEGYTSKARQQGDSLGFETKTCNHLFNPSSCNFIEIDDSVYNLFLVQD